jgi:hypothetical protein
MKRRYRSILSRNQIPDWYNIRFNWIADSGIDFLYKCIKSIGRECELVIAKYYILIQESVSNHCHPDIFLSDRYN